MRPADRTAIGAFARGGELTRRANSASTSAFLATRCSVPSGVTENAFRAPPDTGLFDLTHLVEHGQRRIDDAGTGHIEAAAQLLDRPDQLVAVPRLVGDQLEQDEAELASIEHAARRPPRPSSGSPQPPRPKP